MGLRLFIELKTNNCGTETDHRAKKQIIVGPRLIIELKKIIVGLRLIIELKTNNCGTETDH